MSESEHLRASESLAAWTVDACPPEEASHIADHVSACTTCASDAGRLRATAGLLSVAAPSAPPPGLRASVLSAARLRRPPGTRAGTSDGLLAPYAGQVATMDAVLASLTPAQWRAPAPKHGSVRRMVMHLTSNDATFASDLGFRPAEAYGPHDRWRTQARSVVRRVSDDPGLLDRRVRLAGPRPPWDTARGALVQRAFETWVHADDIRAAVGRPLQPPPAEHLRLIIDFGTGLLPDALRVAGRHHPDRTARLVLTGPAGGEWAVPLAPHTVLGEPDVVITAGAEDFCRLLAGRLLPQDFAHRSVGDPALAADLLRTAATLGCD